ncbi:MAG: thermonuclease family protein [Rhizobiaceae bacterium]|nr:thermonuclease family protein [Rhizobiaceae bacterium]
MRTLQAVSFIAFLALPSVSNAAPACGLYQYHAEITDVYDGDTVTADIDLGFNTWRRGERLRLFGIDTPELKGPDRELGLAARDALRSRILGKGVIICTIRDDNSSAEQREKYGRYLAKIYIDDELINDWLVQQGLARAYSGGARQLFSVPAQ